MSEIFFTMDVEDPEKEQKGGFQKALVRILDWLRLEQRRGTFFIVGELALNYPDVVKAIAADGHEVGLHGWRHVELCQLTETEFFSETERGKRLLESITGKPVVGYRAPMFSLTRETPWVESCLEQLGFTYSSSVLPAANPRSSYSGAPRRMFSWPSGLVELPAPVINPLVIGPKGFAIPFLGGIYFRYLPNLVIKHFLSVADSQVDWFYCHPYDFCMGEGYISMIDTPYWVNRLLMLKRKKAFEKMQCLFQQHESNRTLSELVSEKS